MSNDVVLIAVDGSKQADEAFEWYIEHLHKPENKIILAHSIETGAMPTRESWEQQTNIGKTKAKELKAKMIGTLSNLSINAYEWVEDIEKPGEFICELAKRKGASYVVIGTRGLGTLKRMVMGSVSQYVVHRCCCPVFVCRQKDESQR